MITKEIALSLSHGQTLYHLTHKNADGSALRVRVSGKVKTWKRRPDDFEFPVKYGFYQSLRISNKGVNRFVDAAQYSTEEPENTHKQVRAAALQGDYIQKGV